MLPIAVDSTYWQQRVAYRIQASLDEPSGVLSGNVRIKYVNQSPDTLRDFYVHQYLNAFRPGSRWSAADSAEGRVRFQHMKDPDYAFERITQGSLGTPDYPYAPDSTIAHWRLPRALAPGDSMVANISWTARPSTLPRRQGRQGRRFDFAQWYPKVVVYDKYGWEDHPLYPAGEFYGEFAHYNVTLFLAEDQVIGATGVPVLGDPGWERANANPSVPVDYQRDWYTRAYAENARARGLVFAATNDACNVTGLRERHQKCVQFEADSVHHFAFSLNPDYRYAQGRYKDVVVHVLYQPGDSATWGKGIAVQRTEMALAWLDSLYGTFAWPQITNVHRIEGGGTEFPMMIMDGSPGLGLIVHELGHNYTMGILANNEWREGYLDEGFTSFQTDWFFESHGQGSQYAGVEADLLLWDLDRWSEPVSMVSERYRDFDTYNTMIYEKGALFFEQLRYIVGDDVMRKILRTYYARWRLKHVDENAFRSVAEEVSHQDLKWFFGQWLHGTPLIDYQIGKVKRRHLPDGRWLTAVTVDRIGDGWMPIEVGDADTIYARVTGQSERERVEFITARKPKRLVLDPRQRAHDWNALNNGERPRGLVQIDNPTRAAVRRDRVVVGFLPLAWFNDHGGTTLALQARSNYLGRFSKSLLVYARGFDPDARHREGFYARVANPIARPMARTEMSFAAWSIEGRAGIAFHTDRSLRRHLSFGPDPHLGFDAIWMAVTDTGYVDRRLWDNAGTAEAGPWFSVTNQQGDRVRQARIDLRGGIAYRNAASTPSNRYDIEGLLRGTGEVSWRTPRFRLRLFAGAAFASINPFASGSSLTTTMPPLQRRIMVAGADSYTTFTNPLLRSRGALFVRPDFHYHSSGDANLRGFRPDLGGRFAFALNIEGTQPVFRRPSGTGLFANVTLEAFADLGLVDSAAVPGSSAESATGLYDAGVGIVTRHRINELAWTMRLEAPVIVNRWDNAVSGTGKRVAWRWVFSLEPSF